LAGRRKIDNRAVTLGGHDLAVVSELTDTLPVFEDAGHPYQSLVNWVWSLRDLARRFLPSSTRIQMDG
jgi:hypothetical protein